MQVGNAVGSRNMESTGEERHAKGEAETGQARAKGLAEGMMDQMSGYKDSVVGAIMGDKSQQAGGNVRKEAGEAKKEANK